VKRFIDKEFGNLKLVEGCWSANRGAAAQQRIGIERDTKGGRKMMEKECDAGN